MSEDLPTAGTEAEALQFLARGPHALAESGYSAEIIISASIQLTAILTAMVREDMAIRLEMAGGTPVFKAYSRAFRALVELRELVTRIGKGDTDK